MTEVARVGDTVRRRASSRVDDVAGYLRALADVGFTGSPRWLGLDQAGFETVQFIPGDVVASPDDVPLESLDSVGRLLRGMHEASRHAIARGPEVICHNDVAPRNTVFRDGVAMALIDWDLADLGGPEWDLAHAVWQFALAATDAQVRTKQMLIGYGYERAAWPQLLDTIDIRIRATRNGILDKARAGDAAHAALVREGVIAELDGQLTTLARDRPAMAAWFCTADRS